MFCMYCCNDLADLNVCEVPRIFNEPTACRKATIVRGVVAENPKDLFKKVPLFKNLLKNTPQKLLVNDVRVFHGLHQVVRKTLCFPHERYEGAKLG